ncbi:MAG: DEAD/DEAH box helicase [Gammaproteobacteria bacterium]|jgi:ATP-dependent RNA helicase RhlE|nr:DEAD/DEAH box helicase [Gammaproteobacteria bacterium]NBT44304.1 DEAD/DEAH box helicase [Gammaproteobacteria bacterium]NBY22864.1 DEAD/DEAH box helicase [Gammaproteobacteria bacterium]NDE34254.1 DEAD/DEAH box helicase [Gammaproteobacteria bacterium]NDG88231.1 DEAD/DEAH box helicase [Gammaproteobacteria bacterium]
MDFTSLGLDQSLLEAIAEQGYTTPTPIQSQAIPAVLEGRDLLAAAQTGTGKTAAFTLPLLQRLIDQGTQQKPLSPGRSPRILILVPTRELAAQVSESVANYGKRTPLRQAVIFGGVGMQPQINALRSGVDFLIATPGRLLDLVAQGHAKLNRIEVLVLDEADRMLDMGFIRDIKKIVTMVPKVRQNLLFSATFSKEIRELASGLLYKPQSIEVAARNATADRVEQHAYQAQKDYKQPLLVHLMTSGLWGQTLIFTRTKHGANRLSQQLERDGFLVGVIHGNKSQSARTKALNDFKEERIQVLVATDIAARGLDIPELPHVVNYELPDVPADYVHRIGRTGRAGAGGVAISLVSREEAVQLRDIERLLGRKLPLHPMPEDIKPLARTQEPAPSQRPTARRDTPGSRREPQRNHRQPAHGERRGAVRTS